jgi:hypothetical protein
MWGINSRKTYSLIRVGLNYLEHLLIASIPCLRVTLRAILQRNGRDLFFNYSITLFQLHKFQWDNAGTDPLILDI